MKNSKLLKAERWCSHTYLRPELEGCCVEELLLPELPEPELPELPEPEVELRVELPEDGAERTDER